MSLSDMVLYGFIQYSFSLCIGAGSEVMVRLEEPVGTMVSVGIDGAIMGGRPFRTRPFQSLSESLCLQRIFSVPMSCMKWLRDALRASTYICTNTVSTDSAVRRVLDGDKTITFGEMFFYFVIYVEELFYHDSTGRIRMLERKTSFREVFILANHWLKETCSMT